MLSKQRHRGLAVLVTGIILASLFFSGASAGQPSVTTSASVHDNTGTAPVAASIQPPETCDGFLTTFRNMSGLNSLDAYTEYDVIRTQASVEVQVGQCDDAKLRRMEYVYRILVSFEQAYQASQDQSSQSRLESLQHADRTASAIEGLRNAGGREYVVLSRLALDRFYRNRGERFNQLAEQAGPTPKKVELLRLAARAFNSAGLAERYGRLTIRADRMEADYQQDIQQVNESTTAARTFLDNCRGSCDSLEEAMALGPAVFGHYRQAERLRVQLETAVQLAKDQNLDERSATTQNLRTDIQAAHESLAVASAILVFGYVTLLLLVTMVGLIPLIRWRRDLSASRDGDMLMVEGLTDV